LGSSGLLAVDIIRPTIYTELLLNRWSLMVTCPVLQ